MDEEKEISQLKREIKLLKDEREKLLEANEDAHLIAAVSENLNTLEDIGEIVENILEAICILKNFAYASFLINVDGRYVVSQEYINSEVSSLLKQGFAEEDYPLFTHVIKSSSLSNTGVNIHSQALDLFPPPPKDREIYAYCLISVSLDDGTPGVIAAATFNKDPVFVERTVPIIERLAALAASRIGVVQMIKVIEGLNEKLRERLGEKRAKLTESEERYRMLVESANDAIFIADAETGIILDVNKKAEELLGLPAASIVGMHQTELHPKEDAERYLKFFIEAVKAGKSIIGDVFVEGRDGEKIPVEISASLVEYGGKKLFQGIFRDVTERIEAHEALRASEEKASAISESSMDAIIMIDGDGAISYWNPASSEMFGFSEKEAMGRKIHDFMVSDEARKKYYKGLPKFEKTGKCEIVGKTLELTALRKDGTRIPVEVSISAIQVQGAWHSVGIIRDITERKQAEDAIRESEARFRRLSEHAPDIIYRFRIYPDLGFDYINDAISDISGYEPDEFYKDPELGMKIIHPEDRGGLRGIMNGKLPEIPHVVRWIRKDGGVIWTEDRHTPIYSEEGKLLAIEGIARDITERKKVEEKLTESEERFRNLSEASFEAVAIHDKRVVLEVNKQFTEMFGYEFSEISGKTGIPLLIAPESRETVRKYFAEDNLGPFEIFGLKKNGQKFPIEVRAKLQKAGGKTLRIAAIRDITERKKAEDALQESEKHLNEAQQIAHLGSWDWDISNNTETWSQETYDIFGVNPKNFTPNYENFINAIHPDDRKSVAEAIGTGLEKDEPVDVDYRIRRPDGTQRNVNSKGKVIRNKKGSPIRMAGTCQDITERKQAEEALIESEEKFRTVVSQLDAITFILNDKGVFELSEGRGLKALGLKPGEAVGQSALDMYKDFPETAETIKRALKGEVRRAILEVNGVVFDVLYTPLTDENGNVERVVGVATDLTERKKAEEALHKSENRFRSIFNHANDVILYVDRFGKILEVNDKINDLLGITSEEVVGKHFSKLGIIRPKDLPKLLKYFKDTLRKGKVVSGFGKDSNLLELELKNKNGDLISVETSTTLIKSDGKIEGFLTLIHDTSERKKAEEELAKHRYHLEELVSDRTKELSDARDSLINMVDDVTNANKTLEEANIRLVEADRLKSVFLASMSHELRTPLNSIIGFTGIILQGLAGEINAEQSKQLEIVYSNSRHLLSLIEDLLDLSKIESGKAEIEAEKFSISEVVSEVIGSMRPEIARKELSLKKSLGKTVVETDRRFFKQIILNLVDNAVKYTSKGGIEITAATREGDVVVSVSDTGRGVKAADLPRLFEPFETLGSRSKSSGTGTGLGLYHSKRIAQHLGGELEVESQYHKGSVFRLRLPKSRGVKKEL